MPKKTTNEKPILFSGPMVKAILEGRKTVTRRVMRPQPIWDPSWGTAVGMNGAWLYGSPAWLGLSERGDRWGTVFDEEHRLRACTEEAYGWGARAGCPYGVPGGRLWVKETWAPCDDLADGVEREDPICVWYAADKTAWRIGAYGERIRLDTFAWREPKPLRPSIYMPRWASRLTLEIVSVRAERLQEISEADAIAEGARHFPDLPSLSRYGQDPRWSFFEATSVDQCLGSARHAFGNAWNKINGARADWDSNPFVWVVTFKRVEGGAHV